MVKYSVTFLSGKIENLEPIINDLENQVINVRFNLLIYSVFNLFLKEIKEATSIGFKQLKK